MKIDDISKIVNMMSEHGLTEFELEEDGRKISMKRGGGEVVHIQQVPMQPVAPAQQAAMPVLQEVAPAEQVKDTNIVEIKAPFVGTFYRAASPDSEPYVAKGQEVGPESVLCILEAMKVMNEIQAEMRGVIEDILVDNASPVQFAQVLFKIRKI